MQGQLTIGVHFLQILSTNIAETSVTIDDVVFVIDSGKVKEVSTYFVTVTLIWATPCHVSKGCQMVPAKSQSLTKLWSKFTGLEVLFFRKNPSQSLKF